jgi:thymidylate kinase
MDHSNKLIVMSGLPGSGKTSLGRMLAELLDFEYIDKDDILESLLSQHKNFSSELRQRLSRESDLIFREQATRGQNAVLTSFWRAPNGKTTSGTPSDWLPSVSDNIIEILCHCDLEVALDRFLNRKRHPGHMDRLRDRSSLQNQFENLLANWPLGFGRLIEIDTSSPVGAQEVLDKVRKLWPAS